MKSIVFTYPDFRSLPKGLKQLLVTSENLFFAEARPEFFKPGTVRSKIINYWSRVQPDNSLFLRSRFGAG